MSVQAIIWDWNGTLCDDRSIFFDAFRQTLSAEGLAPPSDRQLIEKFDRPLRKFFENVFGHSLEVSRWESLQSTFRSFYRSREAEVSLVEDAHDALARAYCIVADQFLLSLAAHEEVMHFARKCGIARWFSEIRGAIRPDQHKPTMLQELIARRSLDPSRVVHIGDALEDAAAARAVGAVPVLVTGASLQAPDPILLQELNPFVANSLSEAVDYAAAQPI